MSWLNSTDWYKGNPNYMTFEEAAAVTSDQFKGTNNAQKKAIVTFDEAKYFTSVTDLNGAFTHCTLLESITIPDSVTRIGGYAFEYCSSLTNITIPDNVTSIGTFAFYGCTSLALTSLPNGITSMGDYAFGGCTSLALTSLPSNLTTIEYSTFGNCKSLALTSLPSGITSIGKSAFSGCTSLTLTSLPSGITNIGEKAFLNCHALKDTLYEIPSSVMEIGEYAFGFIEFSALKFLGLNSPTFGNRSIYATPQKVDCQVPLASLADYQDKMRTLTDAELITISTY